MCGFTGRHMTARPTGACAGRELHHSPPMTNPDPPFTPEHEELRDSIRGFIDRELAPHSQTWEDEQWFPDEVFGKLAAQGLLGLKYPTELGGQGGDYLHEAVMCEEMARIGSGGTAAGIGAHVNIATPPIWKFGTERAEAGLSRAGDPRREDRRARHHRAGRGLGRRGAAHAAPSAWTAAGC